jgi:tRNA A37 threonylcarbamoyladenosine biosynthesis protein TsaE
VYFKYNNLISIIISIALMAIILVAWGNKQDERYTPMQIKVSTKRLKNQETSNLRKHYKLLLRINHITQ